jgi:UPF0271 protein
LLIDLNADVGEGFETQELLNWVTSVNIACGGHAGDERSMAEAVQSALKHALKIGAHPSYPDREGFGRSEVNLEDDSLIALIQDQVSGLQEIARKTGASLSHVKPHGALYHRSAHDPHTARVIARAIHEMNSGLALVGLAHSRSGEAALELGLPFLSEAFADRRYEASGALLSRLNPGALITDPNQAATQAREIALKGQVTSIDGTPLSIRAQTLCVHSDTPGAAEIAKAVRIALLE